jgi:formylmethanofuran dehydrogenase subunit E
MPIMGDIPENEQRWDRYAEARGLKCKNCGETALFSERQLYFDRNLCSWCAHMRDKDD